MTTELLQRRVATIVILCSFMLAGWTTWTGWWSPVSDCCSSIMIRSTTDSGAATASTTTVKTAFKNNTPWCPTAQCHDDHTNRHDKRPSCDTCSRRFLIILAQGRSASTTLVEMLDLLPNVRMGGENNNILIRFKEMHERLEQSPYGKWETNQGAWKHNPVNPLDWVCLGQSLVETIYPPPIDHVDVAGNDDTDTILGFKTIRFAVEEERVYNISDHVDYFRALFPCARFLVNIRSDAAAVASSRKRHFHESYQRITSTTLKQVVKEEADMLREAAALFGHQTAMLLDSSQWTKDISLLNRAVSWLGFDDHCHFHELLKFNTKYGYLPTKSKLAHPRANAKCRYIGG